MTFPYNSWSDEFQNRTMTEARRQQAMAVADSFGGAYVAVMNFAKTLAQSVARALVQARQLSELSRLSDRQLADIGINRSDIPAIVAGRPVVEYDAAVPGLKSWKPARASNDWRDSAAA
jgi:uncharacterized protein YjiS (DUF1127 family)